MRLQKLRLVQLVDQGRILLLGPSKREMAKNCQKTTQLLNSRQSENEIYLIRTMCLFGTAMTDFLMTVQIGFTAIFGSGDGPATEKCKKVHGSCIMVFLIFVFPLYFASCIILYWVK